VVGNIIYFDRRGPDNTAAVIQVVKKRCEELGIKHVVVASDSGATAMALSEALPKSITLVAVPEHAGYKGGDATSIKPEAKKQLEEKGVKVLICAHALSGVARSISTKFGGISGVEIIAYTLRRFGEGVKVAVEVAVMAADAGLVPTDREIIAVGGSSRGADAAIVLKAAHMTNFFDLEIREILAKPRQNR
jgi:hypothetical protein